MTKILIVMAVIFVGSFVCAWTDKRAGADMSGWSFKTEFVHKMVYMLQGVAIAAAISY